MSVPQEIFELVGRFDRNREAYKSGQYNETQLRREFIDPFFEALCWDVNNRQGYAESYKDVIHEDAIKVGSATKAPDYCFRIGGVRKFFVESKKPSVNLKDDVTPAFQLRRYAWSAKLPLSILTDFEEFVVYDCRIKPANTDKASAARVFYLTYNEYAQRWDEIVSIFSRDSVLKGLFDKYAESSKVKKGTAEVDDAFLKEIESWRETLARNLALRNSGLTQRELNFAVQMTIDRMVFLRICEDRGIESYGRLMALQNGTQVYKRLFGLFQRADERYNSGLFHFRHERRRPEAPDDMTPGLTIDDKPLKDIIKSLYYPDSPYEFSVLPADILGQVYEQFLGKVIRLTTGHRAIVEDKPEVKKAGGIYYTPTYIVEYIVKNTVGKLLENKNPKQAAKLKILDPACGSGSFLINAYQYLLDWHRDWYIKDGAKKWATVRSPVLYQGYGGDWRLTTTERKRILLNNIYGVDIDSQAVEVTKLSLLLKVLEGENEETLNRQFKLFHERALPDLGSNIKCGNSLIGPDFYKNQQMSFLDDEERYRINVFDWKAEFTEIMKNGGFHAVIGNPPWGATFGDAELHYLKKNHSRVVDRMVDSYLYMIDKALILAKAKEGIVGFIVPSTLLNQIEAKSLRLLLIDKGLSSLINLGQGIFGSKVLNTSTIIVTRSQNDSKDFLHLDDLTRFPISERKHLLFNSSDVQSSKWWLELVKSDNYLTFFTGKVDASTLLKKLRKLHRSLETIIDGEIQRGVSPDVVAAHVVSIENLENLRLENALIRPSISGSQIKRYRDVKHDQYMIYTTKSTQIDLYPKIYQYLRSCMSLNTCKEVLQKKHPWYSLHRPRDPQIFESPKFIGLTTSKTIELVYDKKDSLFVTDAMYVFKTHPKINPKLVMGILQSKLFLFLYRIANQGDSRVIPQVKASKLYDLPIPNLDSDHPRTTLLSKIVELVDRMLSLHRQLAAAKTTHDKTSIQRQISSTDQQIDELVYELYGLTEDEIKIVEEGIK